MSSSLYHAAAGTLGLTELVVMVEVNMDMVHSHISVTWPSTCFDSTHGPGHVGSSGIPFQQQGDKSEDLAPVKLDMCPDLHSA